MEPWQKADELMIQSSVFILYWKNFNFEKDLLNCYPDQAKLYQIACELYSECLQIVATLSKEELQKFWIAQLRNKYAHSVQELLTFDEYTLSRLAQ